MLLFRLSAAVHFLVPHVRNFWMKLRWTWSVIALYALSVLIPIVITLAWGSRELARRDSLNELGFEGATDESHCDIGFDSLTQRLIYDRECVANLNSYSLMMLVEIPLVVLIVLAIFSLMTRNIARFAPLVAWAVFFFSCFSLINVSGVLFGVSAAFVLVVGALVIFRRLALLG